MRDFLSVSVSFRRHWNISRLSGRWRVTRRCLQVLEMSALLLLCFEERMLMMLTAQHGNQQRPQRADMMFWSKDQEEQWFFFFFLSQRCRRWSSLKREFIKAETRTREYMQIKFRIATARLKIFKLRPPSVKQPSSSTVANKVVAKRQWSLFAVWGAWRIDIKFNWQVCDRSNSFEGVSANQSRRPELISLINLNNAFRWRTNQQQTMS